MSERKAIISKRNRRVAINRWQNAYSYKRAVIESNSNKKFNYSILLGFLAGDGSVQKRKTKSGFRYQVDFFPDDDYMLEIYLHCFNDLYKCYPTVKKHNNYYSVRISSNVIGKDLLDKCDLSTNDWVIPENIDIIFWLRAFYSCEAYVGKYIRLQTVNYCGMKSVSLFLDGLNVNHRFYSYDPGGANSKVYIIIIMRKKSIYRFSKLIGFFHARKETKLMQALHL